MLRSLARSVHYLLRRRNAGPGRRLAFRPQVDVLEGRVLLATRVWNGAGPNSLWTTGANWVGGAAPFSGDDLVFPAGAAQLTNTYDFAPGIFFGRLTFSGTGYVVNSQSPNFFLDLVNGISSTGTASGGANNTINAQVRASGTQSFLSLYPDTTLTLNGPLVITINTLTVGGSGNVVLGGAVSGAGALLKTGPGTVSLNSGLNSYAGLTTVADGTLVAGSNSALGGTATGTVVQDGATLEIAFGIITLNEPLTLVGFGVGGGTVGSARGAVYATGIATLNGPITLNGGAAINSVAPAMFRINGNINLNTHVLTLNATFASSLDVYGVISGTGSLGGLEVNRNLASGTVRLLAANTFGGPTTVQAGTLSLTGNGTLASTQYTLNQGRVSAPGGEVGTLQLDNAGTNLADRVPDTAQIFLNGGALSLVGNSAAGSATSERVGTIEITRGHSYVRTLPGTALDATLTLNVTNLRVPGGGPRRSTVEFSGAGLGTSRSRVLFDTAPVTVGSNGGILPYATVLHPSNDLDFATYDVADGVKAFTGYVDGFAGAGPEDTVRLFNPTEVVGADQTVNALLIRTNNAPFGTGTVTVNRGSTLTLSSGGLLMVGLSGIVTPAVVPGPGAGVATLNFVDTGRVFTYGFFSTAIRTRIAGGDGVAFSGSGGGVALDPGTAGNTYGGGTFLNSAGLNVPVAAVTPLGSAAFFPFGGTFSAGGLGTLSLSNQVGLSDARVSLGGLTGMTFAGSITLSGMNVVSVGPAVTFNALFGAGNLLKQGGGDLFLPGANSHASTTLLEGRLIANHPGALGSFPSRLVGGTLLTTMAGGITLNTPITLSQSNVTLGIVGAPAPGPLTFSGGASLAGLSTLTTNEDVILGGTLSGAGGFTKGGQRLLIVAGSGFQTGATTVQGGTLRVNGSMSASPVALRGGNLEGNGPVGAVASHGPGGAIEPGTSLARATLTAAAANLSNGGTLRLQIVGYGTAGIFYDRLDLGTTGTLTLGGTSSLTLDLDGLTMAGTASGVISYGSILGNVPAFTTVNAVNNPNGFTVTLDYAAGGINVVVSGTNQPPVLQPIADRTVPSSQLVIPVPLTASDPDGDPLTFSAQGVSLAYNLDQQYDFFTDGNLYENVFGAKEKWLQSGALSSGWAILLPNGELRAWNGVPLSLGGLLAVVGRSYWEDPLRLINVPTNPRATFSFSGSTLTITRDPAWVSAIHIIVGVSDGRGGFASRAFTVTVTAAMNQPPVLQPIADRSVPSSQQVISVPLSASDPDGDPLTFTATGQSLAWVLTQQTALLTYFPIWDNVFGAGEKWLQATDSQWYFILADGTLYRWDGSGTATGAALGNVGTSYYQDANRLVNVPAGQPRAALSVSGSTLTITRDPAWVSAMVITVTVSDGALTDSKTFTVTVTA